MKNKKKIIYKNSIPKKYLIKKYINKINEEFPKILRNIVEDFKYKKDALHSLNNNFKLGFNKNQLNDFKKFKTVVIIGMGGSILGSEAIYNFLEKDIKKKFIFLDNLDEINTKKC